MASHVIVGYAGEPRGLILGMRIRLVNGEDWYLRYDTRPSKIRDLCEDPIFEGCDIDRILPVHVDNPDIHEWVAILGPKVYIRITVPVKMLDCSGSGNMQSRLYYHLRFLCVYSF